MEFYISAEAERAVEVLEANGFEAFYVGGCVRDNLLGRTPTDFDITTNALPEQTLEVFSDYQVIKTGLKHGTVMVMINKKPIEITTYRVDGAYGDCRHPDGVSFTRSLEEDLKRRDFTVNAMAYNKKSGLVDFWGGAEDLRMRRIRCVGEPLLRFNEDALRILRALRFACVLDFSVEAATARGVHECGALLKHVSVERISAEFNKLLCGVGVERVLTDYLDVIGVFIPEMLPNAGLDQKNKHHIYDVYTHICKAVAAAPPELPLRLAAFFHDIGKHETFFVDEKGVGHFYGHERVSAKIAVRVMERLRCERALTERVRDLILYHDTSVPPTKRGVKRWLNRLSEPLLRQLIQLKKADTSAKSPRCLGRMNELSVIEELIEDILRDEECFCLKDLAINGNDLIFIGIPHGKAVGDILKLLLNAVINEELPNERGALLQKAREYA